MIPVAEALADTVGVNRACATLALPRSAVYRARQPQRAKPAPPRPTPARALSEGEKSVVRETLNSERFQDSAPREVYATLLDDAALSVLGADDVSNSARKPGDS